MCVCGGGRYTLAIGTWVYSMAILFQLRDPGLCKFVSHRGALPAGTAGSPGESCEHPSQSYPGNVFAYDFRKGYKSFS